MHVCVTSDAISSYSVAHSRTMDGKALLKALMARADLNPNAIANLLEQRSLQSQIARFVDGTTRNPRWQTLKPVADYFGVRVEAFFDVDIAEQVAKEQGLLEDESTFIQGSFRQATSRVPTQLQRGQGKSSIFSLLMQLAEALESQDLSARKAVGSLLSDLAISPETASLTADRIERLLADPSNAPVLKSSSSQG